MNEPLHTTKVISRIDIFKLYYDKIVICREFIVLYFKIFLKFLGIYSEDQFNYLKNQRRLI